LSLVENAVKFSMEGLVTVDLELAEAGGPNFRLWGQVSGTGKETFASEGADLLAPFRRTAEATPGEEATSRLGLAISRGLIELMQGRLWINERTGGTMMGFEILLDRDPVEWSEKPFPALVIGRMAVLVDANVQRREVMRERLTHWGLVVAEADGAEAARGLVISGEEPPAAIVVATATVPEWRELGTALRERAGGRTMILAMAPLAAFPDVPEAQAAGYSDVIGQNVREATLRELLTRPFSPDEAGDPMAAPCAARSKCPFACRILFVADNAAQQRSAAALAENLGCHLEIASRGGQAVDLVSAKPYDLVLIDLSAPELEAMQAASRMRCSYGPSQLAIVGLAPEIHEELRKHAREAGFTAVHAQPLEERVLRAACRWSHAERGEPAYDHQAALGNCGGDEPMLRELANRLRGVAANLIKELLAAAGQRDDGKAAAIVRQIQGAAALFSAPLLAAACDEVALAAERLEWARLPAVTVALRVQLLRLLAQLPCTAEGRP
jgi:CheY-like chemotaxis protein